MKQITNLVRSFGVAIWLSCGPAALAQQAHQMWSIEALTAVSADVFTGNVLSARRGPASATGAGDLSVVVRVGAVYRGSVAGTINLSRQAQTAAGWQLLAKRRASAVFFVFKPAYPSPLPFRLPNKSWCALPLGEPRRHEEAAYDERRAITATLQIPTSASAVRAALQAACASRVAPSGYERMEPCPAVHAEIGYKYEYLTIIVPVVPKLEAFALGLIRKPADVLPKVHTKDDELWMRMQGVLALANFRSASNIKVLESLLTDKGEASSFWRGTRLWVRLAAYQVLSSWDVKVRKPSMAAAFSASWAAVTSSISPNRPQISPPFGKESPCDWTQMIPSARERRVAYKPITCNKLA